MKVYQRGLIPYDSERPLLIHVLTHGVMNEDVDGEPLLPRLIAAGATLVPLKDRDKKAWGVKVRGGASLIHPRDVVAGDARYLFFSVATTYDASPTGWAPALAFDFEDLKQLGPLGFRPHDLESAYLQAEKYVTDADDRECAEGESDEDCDNRARAETVAEELKAISDCGTIHGPRDVDALVRNYNARFAGKYPPDADDVYRIIDAHNAAASCTRADVEDNPALEAGVGSVNWFAPFRALPSFSNTGGKQGGPEVVLEGRAPLALARYFRFLGTWHENEAYRKFAGFGRLAGDGPTLLALPQRRASSGSISLHVAQRR